MKKNPLSLLTAFASSSPERGSFLHLPVYADKAPPSGELASGSETERVLLRPHP